MEDKNIQLFNASTYSSDELKLQNVLPEEIWLLIFNNISESVHYHPICASSPYFKKLLLPLQTSILFPEVSELLVKQKLLKLKSLFTCRAVCTKWRRGVGLTFHQTLSQTWPDFTDWKYFERRSCDLSSNQNRLLHWFPDESEIDKFLAKFHDSHFLTGNNPFPYRSISNMTFSSDRSTHYNKLLHILQIYGHHIWHCFVMLGAKDTKLIKQELLFLRSLLQRLPQLQTLRIENIVLQPETELVQKFLLENPLPKLEKLELLEEGGNIERPMFSQLIQNNPQITKLKLDYLDSDKHAALFTTPLPNMEELHLLTLKSTEDFLQLQNAQYQWPLKKLTVCCPDDIPHVNIVFNLIETKWAGTLTDLNLFIPSSVSVTDIGPLQLPHLQNLKLKMRKYVCMDFVLSLSNSLVNLGVRCNGKYDKKLEKESTIKFFLHRENLLKSNIWEHLVNLRQVNYSKRLYRRNNWKILNNM